MKNTANISNDKVISKYNEDNIEKSIVKRSNINVLLNRIELNKKNENRKKLFFSAAASTGLILFGFIIF